MFLKKIQFITHSIPFLPSDPIHEQYKSWGLNKTERQRAHNYQVLDDVIIKYFQIFVLVHHFLRLAFIAVVLNMLGKVYSLLIIFFNVTSKSLIKK